MRKLNYIFLFVMFILTCTACMIALVLLYRSQNRVVSNQFPLREKWVFEADTRITTTPVVYKDKVLFRTIDKLYAVHTLNGNLAWTFSLSQDNHADPPLAQGNYVVFTHLKGTTALDIETGEVVWEVFSKNTRVDAVPVVASKDKVVIVDNSIMIRNLETGDLLWEIQNPYGRSDAIVKLQNNNLYVVFADQIRNYNFDTGELIWQNDTQQWSLQNGILDDNMLYLERRKDGIAAYNLTKQHLEWERDDLFLTDYPPTEYKDTLFIGSRDSVPVAIEALTGRTLWEAVELSEDNYQTPLIFDDTVYIRGLFQKKIYALNPDNGNLIGFIKLGIPDIGFSTNASYSLGPVQAGEIIIFPAGNRLLAYER